MATPHGGGTTGGTTGRNTGGESGDDSVDVGKEIGETIEPLIPWAVSVLFHAGLLLLACFLVWTAAVEEKGIEPIVPNTNLTSTPRARVKMARHDVVTQVMQTNHNTDPIGDYKNPSGGGAGSSSRHVDFGIGASRDGEGKGSGDNKGGDINIISIRGDGGGRGTPFKNGVSGRSEFKVVFMEQPGNARRVVYLIDASGSLIDTLPFVLMELKRSINSLSDKHEFTVIFFQGAEPVEVPVGGKGLKQATSANKRLVTAWLDPDAGNIVPAGLSKPLIAIKLALGYKPELIYLLSDNITGQGRYEMDQRQMLKELTNANRSLTKINTIQFIRPDPLLRSGMPGTMELIAEQTGGVYKYMGARELNIQ